MPNDVRPFRYLNAGNQWPGFHWDGLQLTMEGTLRLEPLPKPEVPLPESIRALPSSSAVSGIAVAADGTIFFTGCARNQLMRITGCFGETEAVPCLAMHQPAGLLLSDHRPALYVADSAAGRVLVFDLDSFQLLDVMTGFHEPVSLAADLDGNLYVVDTQMHCVQRFTAWGDPVPSFWNAVAASGRVTDPRAVAWEDGIVYILDGEAQRVFLFQSTGQLVGEVNTGIPQAGSFAVVSGAIYISDPARRKITVFRPNTKGAYSRVGDAAGYEGPVAALASDRRGGLLVSAACGVAPLRLTLDGSFSADGSLWSDAIIVHNTEHFWNRLHAAMDMEPGANVQFFVHTGAPSAPPPIPTRLAGFAAPWRAISGGVTDFFIGISGPTPAPKTMALWIGARFSNDLDATPVLSQLRLDFDQESYLPYLPAIYRDGCTGDFLLRYLSLFESMFDELEGKIERLPMLLGAESIPVDGLAWLAGFLALDLPETWTNTQQRAAIANAFTRYSRRGTVAGLREALQIETGVRAFIEEPIQSMGWWSLPAHSASCKPGSTAAWLEGAGSILGLNSVLAAAEPQGAVVGTTATLDRSQLISADEYGAPLFEATAYRFSVSVYPGQVDCPGTLERITALLDREKPAHTMYELCLVEPGLRVGYQSRLGVDTLLGGGPAPTRLGSASLVLGGKPRGQIGLRSMVGVETHL